MNKLFDKNIIALLVVMLVLILFGVSQFVMPQFAKLGDKDKSIADSQAQIVQLDSQLQQKKAQPTTSGALIQAAPKLPVIIYTTPYPKLDVENASIGFVDMIIRIIQKSGNKIVEISFTPADCGANVDNCQILSLSMTLECSYISLQKMLKQLYDLPYLTAIKNISLNFTSGGLTGKFNIDLYVKK